MTMSLEYHQSNMQLQRSFFLDFSNSTWISITGKPNKMQIPGPSSRGSVRTGYSGHPTNVLAPEAKGKISKTDPVLFKILIFLK